MLVLASASPRRKELLARAGVAFTVVPADLDETQHLGEPADAYVRRIADGKAAVVAGARPGEWVLAADTTVVVDGDALTKAGDEAEAAAMIARLAGRTHVVMTATCLVGPGEAARRLVATEVNMRALADDEIRAYVASGEWRGKAGAYAAQGIAAAFVTAMRGSVTNVIGLPLAEVLVDLIRTGAAAFDLSKGTPA